MSKEQLKEADEWLYSMRCLLSVKTDEEDRAYTQKRIDLFNWLIKQAELGLIHQEQFHDMQTKNLQLQKRVYELEATIHQDERQDVLEGLYEQNKRYREALEKIVDETYTFESPNYKEEYEALVEIARKALEGEK